MLSDCTVSGFLCRFVYTHLQPNPLKGVFEVINIQKYVDYIVVSIAIRCYEVQSLSYSISSSGLECLGGIKLAFLYATLKQFVQWINDGLYDFCTIPLGMKKHLRLEDDQALQNIPSKGYYTGNKFKDEIDFIDKFDRTPCTYYGYTHSHQMFHECVSRFCCSAAEACSRTEATERVIATCRSTLSATLKGYGSSMYVSHSCTLMESANCFDYKGFCQLQCTKCAWNIFLFIHTHTYPEVMRRFLPWKQVFYNGK